MPVSWSTEEHIRQLQSTEVKSKPKKASIEAGKRVPNQEDGERARCHYSGRRSGECEMHATYNLFR